MSDFKLRFFSKSIILQKGVTLGGLLLLGTLSLSAQINMKAEVLFSPATQTLSVNQKMVYVNRSRDTLHQLYLNDWINAFRDRNSPLGQHFSSEYIKRYHFSKRSERGLTRIGFIRNDNGNRMVWKRPKGHPDIIQVNIGKALAPGDTTYVFLRYTLRIPEDKFTHYGRNDTNDYNLRYWLITPAVYRQGWQVYSNKDLGDLFQPKMAVDITLTLPENYQVYSALSQQPGKVQNGYREVELRGKDRNALHLSLIRSQKFSIFQTEGPTVISDIGEGGMPEANKQVSVQRVIRFLNKRLGPYPFDKLLVTQADYKSSPLYGLNQLPDFIRPFPDGFQYDLQMMKTITHRYLRTSLLVNPRTEYWLLEAIQIDLLMDYVNTFYPDTKLIGTLSKVIGLRWFHIADLGFNYQYQFYFMNMNRENLDQRLTMSRDSLIKFNAEIANPYKAGVGFKYLANFLGDGTLKKTIREFYRRYKLQPVTPHKFERLLKANTVKPVDWFFKQYVQTNVRLDFKFEKVAAVGRDSLRVTIKNKENNSMPVSLYRLKGKKVLGKYWVVHTKGLTTVTIPRGKADRLALNYEGLIPEFNKRDDYYGLGKLLNKPLKMRLIKDVENPYYNEFYLVPDFTYDLYDGFTLGMRVSNKAVLYKPFTYAITPEYGFKSHALIGRLSFLNTVQFRNRNLSGITYGLSAQRYSYDRNRFYYRFSPFLLFSFRHRDLRERERQYITARDVTVYRQKGSERDLTEEPNYSVFNVQYTYSNSGLVNSLSATFDYQLAKKFSKFSLTAKYRKLFLNNIQMEFRFFGGMFLYNHTKKTSDYFSFALDRPSDYMFDYNYYGRSESSGLFSQQFIEAEGGFKSKLQPAFANRWLTTFDADVSVWPDLIYAYGDVGLVKNHGHPVQFKYDSGFRLSLVQDYFELFFPMYSSLGWEAGQPHYAQKIRFIVTLDFQTLIGLFKRTYY